MTNETKHYLNANDIYQEIDGDFWHYTPEEGDGIHDILKTYPNGLTRIYTECGCDRDLIYSIDDAKYLIKCIND